MKKTLEIYQIDAFTTEPFMGNPAGAAFGDNLTSAEMQKIAAEMNLAETAFLSKSDKADYTLRWFTPAVEVDLCGHATIGSLHFLNEHNLLKDKKVTFSTRSGILNCGMNDGNYFMQIPVFSMEEFKGNQEEILKTLGMKKQDFDSSVPMVLLQNKYLYIYIKKLDVMKGLKPDFKTLADLTRIKNEFEAVVVFSLETFDKEDFACSRFFAPAYGINEDIVTGSANGPLILVLQKLGFVKSSPGKDLNFTFEQGDFLGRKGRVTVSYSPDKNELCISGKAVTVLKGEIYF